MAVVLDQQDTTENLIPFLESILDRPFCHDEVLLNLADQLGTLVPFIGGPAHAHLLFTILEKLAQTDDTYVRERSVHALKTIAGTLNDEQIENHFIPLVFKLAESDYFTSKCSASGLFSVRKYSLTCSMF